MEKFHGLIQMKSIHLFYSLLLLFFFFQKVFELQWLKIIIFCSKKYEKYYRLNHAFV